MKSRRRFKNLSLRIKEVRALTLRWCIFGLSNILCSRLGAYSCYGHHEADCRSHKRKGVHWPSHLFVFRTPFESLDVGILTVCFVGHDPEYLDMAMNMAKDFGTVRKYLPILPATLKPCVLLSRTRNIILRNLLQIFDEIRELHWLQSCAGSAGSRANDRRADAEIEGVWEG